MTSKELKGHVDAISDGEQQADSAKKLFTESNLRLVVSIAKLSAVSVRDRRAQDPADELLQNDLCAFTRQSLSILNSRQQIVLRHRFGIDLTGEHTLQEIGDMFLSTRERVRQIEAKALRQLRIPAAKKKTKRAAGARFQPKE